MRAVRTCVVSLACGAVLASGQAALAGSAAPVTTALSSAGAGTTPQSVVVPLPDAGRATLLDPTGAPTDLLSVEGVGSYALDRGVLTFRPALGYVGRHGVVYRTTDAFQHSGEGTYTAQVVAPAAPAAIAVRSTGVGTARHVATVGLPPAGNAVLLDRNGAAMAALRVDGVGLFSSDPASGVLSFTPVVGFAGSATIGYRTTDAYGQSSDAAYTADVFAPQAPVARAMASRAAGGREQRVRLPVAAGTAGSLVDPAGHDATHVFLPGRGNVALDPATGIVVLTPARGFHGVWSIRYRLADAYAQVAENAWAATVLASRTAKAGTPGCSRWRYPRRCPAGART